VCDGPPPSEKLWGRARREAPKRSEDSLRYPACGVEAGKRGGQATRVKLAAKVSGKREAASATEHGRW